MHTEEIFNFIRKCEVHKDGKIGFVFSPYTKQTHPDLWSTYFALASLKLLGLLKEYLLLKGQEDAKREINRFILTHKTSNGFQHCLDKDCVICKKTSQVRTLYFVLELFKILGVDTRTYKEEFRSFTSEKKKDPSVVFKLLCTKYLELENTVRDKDIQYIYQFQKENSGFSFKDKVPGRVNTSFWIIYTLDLYSWLVDYNPVGFYSFITSKINEIVRRDEVRTVINLMELSKLIILLSIIWKKFIKEIEKVIFRQLEKEQYIDLNQIKSTFGLIYGIEEVISYINYNYTLNLRILDNQNEFNNYVRTLTPGKRKILTEIYKSIFQGDSIISLSDIMKRFKSSFLSESLKLKDDILPLVTDMESRNFFKGKIRTKKGLRIRTKYYYYIDTYIEEAIVSDTEINTERLYLEKDKLLDIKNDIYNMTLSLKGTSSKIKEEVESYLILGEVNYAKERLKYVIRNALMDAGFLNENIENSFNEDLYYINIQTSLAPEIKRWSKLYSVLSQDLKETDVYLREKIAEKEEIRNLSKVLDQLDDKIFKSSEEFNRKLINFRKIFIRSLEKGYTEEGFKNILQEFEKLRDIFSNFDKKIYIISQKIAPKEKIIVQKHKDVINNWVSIKDELNMIFDYYFNGFSFFQENLDYMNKFEGKINNKINDITEKTKQKINESEFQEAFTLIKKETDELLSKYSKKIREIRSIYKKEIKSKQKLYLLYRYLPEKIKEIEENVLKLVAEQEQSLKDKVSEERNRIQIEDFDHFVSKTVLDLKNGLSNLKKELESSKEFKVKDVLQSIDKLKEKLDQENNIYLTKLKKCKELISTFDISNVTIMQWENFNTSYINEIDTLKDDFINNVINERISIITDERKTNNIKIAELKKELNLKCNVLIDHIKEMIEISKLDAKLYEDKKCVVIFTEYYYKNKELKGFIENSLIKLNSKNIGKILGLYDSSIRNRTLRVNMLELQNRIQDFSGFEGVIRSLFNKKADELQIEIESREEYLKTKKQLDDLIENNNAAILSISNNLKLFNHLQDKFEEEFTNLKSDLTKKYAKYQEFIEKDEPHTKIRNIFDTYNKRFDELVKAAQQNIEAEIKSSLSKADDSVKIGPEIRELFVKIKNTFLQEYEDKQGKLNSAILELKNDTFRNKLLEIINNRKIFLSQLLGTLQKRVEDFIDFNQYKKANIMVQKRVNNIREEVSDVNKAIKTKIKEFNKQSKDFETQNKYIIDDFNQFLKEFDIILIEKVKSLEQFILKSYVGMTVKALTNEFVTLSFLNNELKIKRKTVQDHLIFLIAQGELKGKYDPRLMVYYENPEVFENLDEQELEVVKKMNYRVNMFLLRLKHFLSQYYIIFAFIAAVLSITTSVYTLTGGDPASLIYPIAITFVIVAAYLYLKREKDAKA